MISKLYKGLILFSFILFLLQSCSEQNQQPYYKSNLTKIEITNFDSPIPWNNVHVDDVIQLETNEKSVIGLIHKVEVINERIIVHDLFNHKLLVFNNSGKFLFQVGKRGRGPGEYPDIRGYTISREADEVLILTSRKIIKYSFKDGQYIKTENLKLDKELYNPFRFIATGQREYLFWDDNLSTRGQSGDDLQSALYLVRNGRVVRDYIKLKDRVTLIPRFIRHGDDWYIIPQPTSNIIRKYSQNILSEKYLIDFGDNGLPGELASELMTKMTLDKFFKNEYYKAIRSFFETTDYIYFTCIGPGAAHTEFLYNKSIETNMGGKVTLFSPSIYCVDEYGWFYGVISNSTLVHQITQSKAPNSLINQTLPKIDELNTEDNPVLIKFKPISLKNEE